FSDYGNTQTAFGEPLVFPGGISYGKVTVDSNGNIVTAAGVSTIEVANLLLGEGNDHVNITSTLVPALELANNGTPTAAFQGGLTLVHGGGNSPLRVQGTFNVTGGVGANQILRTDGLNWADDEFALGQQVTISGVAGTRTVTAVNGSTLTVDGAALASGLGLSRTVAV